jgi:hypothetical protein
MHEEAEFLAAHSQFARSVLNETEKLDDTIKRATHNELDLKVLVPLALAIYSAFEFGAEVATPIWLTLGIFSVNSFIALHPPVPYAQSEAQAAQRNPQGR